MPRVSVVIPHHRDPSLLDIVLGSLSTQSFRDFEAIVVDDASRDGSAEHLRERWPAVRVVRTGERSVGVTAAFNLGIGAAAGELVALINNDVELDPRWLEEVVATLDGHDPAVGMVASRMRNYYRRDELDGAGDVFSRFGAGSKRGNGELDRGQFDDANEVLAPSGGAGLYRVRALNAVGPFDEWLHAYFEDVDWGLRAQALGYRCRYAPRAIAYHMEGRTTGGKADPRFHALQWRNTLAILIENVPSRFLVRNAHRIAYHQVAGVAASARAGLLAAHARGVGAALLALPYLLRERRRRAAVRVLGAGEYCRAISAGQ